MSADDEGSSSKTLNTLEEMESEFIRGGERQRLQEIMVKRLKESGWTSKIEIMCKDAIEKKGLEHMNLEDLIAEVRDPARKLVPDEVKKELMQHIQEFVYNNTDLSPDK
uniref:Transcription and mRNA export factor ENY2 n=1 Tax=Ditylenchus dipsaci TaxID=166011 RepID=A0A915EED0_9BILA